MNRAPAWQRYLIAAACCYEVAALFSPLPTYTNLVHRFPALKAPVLAALDIHFEPGGAW